MLFVRRLDVIGNSFPFPYVCSAPSHGSGFPPKLLTATHLNTLPASPYFQTCPCPRALL
jgi:hypothetical protein